jgi:hypothetical protein
LPGGGRTPPSFTVLPKVVTTKMRTISDRSAGSARPYASTRSAMSAGGFPSSAARAQADSSFA